jgi:hypothetical protein
MSKHECGPWIERITNNRRKLSTTKSDKLIAITESFLKAKCKKGMLQSDKE